MDKCIFCQIVNGEIPCYKLYEDQDVLAFLDVNPTTRGHTLVISKQHYDNFLSTPKDVMHKVMDVAQRIGQIDCELMGAKGVNILTNCYEEAGQSVMHYHVHVIPRYGKDDCFRLTMDNIESKKLNLPAIAEEISKLLK